MFMDLRIQHFQSVCNDDIWMYDVTDIDKSIQGSSGNVEAAKKSKLYVKVRQADESDILHTLWPVGNCEKASENLFSSTFKLM